MGSLRQHKFPLYSYTSKSCTEIDNIQWTPSNPIFSNLGILKYFDIAEVLNILFIHQHLNQNLPSDLLKTSSPKSVIHSAQEAMSLVFSSHLLLKPKTMAQIIFQNLQLNNGMTSMNHSNLKIAEFFSDLNYTSLS